MKFSKVIKFEQCLFLIHTIKCKHTIHIIVNWPYCGFELVFVLLLILYCIFAPMEQNVVLRVQYRFKRKNYLLSANEHTTLVPA